MLPEVNLLPKYERTESRLYSIFLIGLILLLIAAGMLSYFYFSTSNDLEAAESRVAELQTEKDILQASLQVLEKADVEGPSLTEAVDFIEEHRLPTSALIHEYIAFLPDNAYLSHVSFDYQTVHIQTQFESIPATSTYVADLTKSDLLDNVMIDNIGTIVIEEVSTTEEEQTEAEALEAELLARYGSIPRYDVSYSMDVNKANLAKGEEDDETAISGE